MSTHLYRFFNIAKMQHGEPFAMCDKHEEHYRPGKIPVFEFCSMEKIGNDTPMRCEFCEVGEPFDFSGANHE